MLLDAEPDFEVVAEAEDAEGASRYTSGHKPHVLVLDLNMPGESGLQAIPRIREGAPETQIVILTMQSETAFAREAMQKGARAYVLKEAAESELVKAVQDGRRGADLPSARARREARLGAPSPRATTTSPTASSRCSG